MAKYGLNDDIVKRIATISHHTKGNMMKNISSHFHTLNTPETQTAILQAHTKDAYQHKFSNKDEENTFKIHIAKVSAINRGTLDPVPAPAIAKA